MSTTVFVHHPFEKDHLPGEYQLPQEGAVVLANAPEWEVIPVPTTFVEGKFLTLHEDVDITQHVESWLESQKLPSRKAIADYAFNWQVDFKPFDDGPTATGAHLTYAFQQGIYHFMHLLTKHD